MFFPEDTWVFFGFFSLAVSNQFGFDVENLNVSKESQKFEWKIQNERIVNLTSSSFKLSHRYEISTAMNIYRMINSEICYSLRDFLVALIEHYQGSSYSILRRSKLIMGSLVFALGFNKHIRLKGPRFFMKAEVLDDFVITRQLKKYAESKSESFKEFLFNPSYCRVETVESFVKTTFLNGKKHGEGKLLSEPFMLLN